MSTRSARSTMNRSLLFVLSALASVACTPMRLPCPDGFALSPEDGRCVMLDAGAMFPGDGGPRLASDAGVDGARVGSDAFVAMPDAFVPPADACAWGTWYVDGDGDGFGNPSMPVSACAHPAGTVSAPTDCADADPMRHPGATEVCNGQDDNCDGNTDEGLLHTYYVDCDGDGFAPSTVGALHDVCADPPAPTCATWGSARRWTETAPTDATNTDCFDTAPDYHPGNVYYPDCDGDDYPAAGAVAVVACSPPAMAPAVCSPAVGVWTARAPGPGASDCSDVDRFAHPGSTRVSTGPVHTADGSLSYDYDCDGAQTRELTAAQATTNPCTRDIRTGNCTPSSVTWQSSAPACGVTGSTYTCVDTAGSCVATTPVARTQACH